MKTDLKPLGTRKQEYLLGVVRDALKAARMEHADFHQIVARPCLKSPVCPKVEGETYEAE